VSKHYDKGQLLPINVLVEVPGSDLSTPGSLALIRATEDRLAAVPGVKSVRSIVAPSGDGVTPDGFRPSVQVANLAKSIVPSGDPQAALKKLLEPDATAGIDSASGYLAALAGAYPKLADVASYKASQADLAAFKAAIEEIRNGSRVSTQLTALADALTNPAIVAGNTAELGALLQAYLQELAKAYPDVVGQPGFQGAVAALQGLQKKLDLALVAQLSTSLRDLAATFKDRPDAYLISTTLPSIPASKAAQQKMADLTTRRLPGELTSLAGEFATRPDFFLPAGMSGEAGTQVAQAMSAYFSEPRDVTRLYVILADDPYSTTAFNTAQTLRSAMTGDAATYGDASHVYVGGPTAEFLDVQRTISEDFLRVAIITVIGVFIVLVLLLRALIAPIYLVLTVLLSFGASMGLSTMIFQDYLGHAGVNYFVPLLVFVLLVALGSDYNIFLMSRVREESDKRGVKDGIRFASARTGTVITSAGIILAGTFAALMTAQVQILFQVGFAVALGVLIDTFVVRSMLVPAITAFVGDFAWWPVGRRPHAPSFPAAVAEPPMPPPPQA
jgi:RND superfamily putative drug exporter